MEVPKIPDRRVKTWNIERMIRVRIDDQPNRRAVALLAGHSQIVLPVDQFATRVRRGPIIAFTDQDQSWNRHRSLYCKAGRIECYCSTELVLRRLFHSAALDRRKGKPAALRKADNENSLRINELLLS